MEANFNLAMLHLQSHPQGTPDFGQALHYFLQSVKKDCGEQVDDLESSFQVLMRPQFAKAYYNIGMIHDRLGDIQRASQFYKRALDKFPASEGQQVPPFYSKVLTNYAVTLEKLGKREEALGVLELSGQWEEDEQEVRVYNNKGIIQKRKGDLQEALASYQAAIDIDDKSFFPHYNLGVLRAQMKDHQAAITSFQRALELAKSLQEGTYQINVHLNLAMVLERMGDGVGALREYQAAQGLDPANQRVKAKIAALQHQSTQSQTTSNFATEQNAQVKGAIVLEDKRQGAIKQASVSKRLQPAEVRLSQPKKGSQELPQPAKNTSYGSSKKFINHNLLPALEVQKRLNESKHSSVILNNSTAKHISYLGQSLVKDVNPAVLDEEVAAPEALSAKQVNERLEEAESARNLKNEDALQEVEAREPSFEEVPDIVVAPESVYTNPYGDLPQATLQDETKEGYATSTDQ